MDSIQRAEEQLLKILSEQRVICLDIREQQATLEAKSLAMSNVALRCGEANIQTLLNSLTALNEKYQVAALYEEEG